MLKALR
jgi:hypothetical protein